MLVATLFFINFYFTILILGYGISVSAFPRALTRGWGALVVSPVTSLSLAVIVYCWSIAIGGTLFWGNIGLVLLAVISLLLSVKAAGLVKTDLKFMKGRLGLLATIFLVTAGPALVVSGVAVQDGAISTPYRIGVDQIGYTSAAESFMHKETPAQLLSKLREDLGIEDDKRALQEVLNSVDYQNLTANIFINIANRWGYSTLLAGISNFLGLQTAYQLSFLLICFFHFVAALSLLLFLARGLHFNLRLSLYAVLVYGMNVNILNSLFEGMYGLIAAFPGLLLALALFVRARHYKLDPVGPILAGVALASSMMIYMELGALYIVVIILGFAYLGFSYRKSPPFKWIALCVFGLVMSYGMLLPRLLLGIVDRAATSGIAGWPQPHWASPVEILGWVNIYTQADVGTWARDVDVAILNFLLMTVLLPLVWVYLRARPSRWKIVFVLPALFFTLFIFLKTRFLDQHHNYQYMKVYTALLPLYLVGFCEIVSRLPKSRLRQLGLFSLFCGLAANFIQVNVSYVFERGLISPELQDKKLTDQYQENRSKAVYVLNEDVHSFFASIAYYPIRLSRDFNLYAESIREFPLLIGVTKNTAVPRKTLRIAGHLERKSRPVDRLDEMVIYESGARVSQFLSEEGRFDRDKLLKYLEERLRLTGVAP